MKKVVIHRRGSYQELRIEEHPEPKPGPGEVLIEVRAIGINYADCVVRMGLYEAAAKYVGWPITPGFEVAGVVAQCGPGATSHELGAEVFAMTRFGGYCTHLVVPENQVFAKPKTFSMEESAGFPTVFLTAYYGMYELAHPRPGQRVLIHSAAGGVGGALLQFSKISELESIAVVGASHKVETARRLGATHVIDKSTHPLWPALESIAPEGCHIIFDANGRSTLTESYRHLQPPGKLVIYGFHSMLPRHGGKPRWVKLAWDYFRTKRFNPLHMTGRNRCVLGFNLVYLFEQQSILADAMKQMLAWIDQGKLLPPIVKTYAFGEVAEAHRFVESGQSVGKLILKV